MSRGVRLGEGKEHESHVLNQRRKMVIVAKVILPFQSRGGMYLNIDDHIEIYLKKVLR